MKAFRAAGDSRGIALFDLDGTITRHDALAPYLAGFAWRHPRRWPRLWRVVPALLDYALRGRDRGRLKSRMIRIVMGGEPRATIDAWSERFVRSLAPRGALHAQARAAIEAHRAAGDRLVLLSASPDLFVPRIGRELGFDQVICTEVRWDGERLDGALLTPNRRDLEKVRCLEALRREFPDRPIVAYGNSSADLPHLERVERGVLVNGNAAARRRAQRAGIATVRWR